MKVSLKRKNKGLEIDTCEDFIHELKNLLDTDGFGFAIDKGSGHIYHITLDGDNIIYLCYYCLEESKFSDAECFAEQDFERLFDDYNIYFHSTGELTEKLKK